MFIVDHEAQEGRPLVHSKPGVVGAVHLVRHSTEAASAG